MIEIFLCIWNMDIAQGYITFGVDTGKCLIIIYQIVKVDEC